MAAKKKCKDCAKHDNYGPLVIVAPQWVFTSRSFIKFVDEAREHGSYVNLLVTGHPTPPPCPQSNPNCKQ